MEKKVSSLIDGLNLYQNYKIDNDELYKELLEVPDAYKFLKKLGMSEEVIKNNMSKIIDFVRDVKYCSNCPGKTSCNKSNPLICTKITYTNGHVDRELVPCKKVLESVKVFNAFIVNDIDKANLGSLFLKLDKTLPRRQSLVNKIQPYLKGIKKEWLYITGKPGTGRSYFASAVANEAAKRKIGSICYLNCVFRFQEAYNLSYSNSDEYLSLMDAYKTCDLLILDDFGNESIKDGIRDNVIFPILHERSGKGLMTIIVSDLSINEIKDLYTTNSKNALRAKQIQNIIEKECKEEINFGNVSIY